MTGLISLQPKGLLRASLVVKRMTAAADLGLIPESQEALLQGMASHSSTVVESHRQSLVGYRPWGHKVGHD